MPYAIYILKCRDRTYYTGLTKDLEARLREQQTGAQLDAYTYSRRPVKLVWNEVIKSYEEAFQWEHQIKGWSRAKKEALIRGDIEAIHEIVKTERRKRDNIKRPPRTERTEPIGT
jgi:predicted GIY-YIG superfamily endonuclease